MKERMCLNMVFYNLPSKELDSMRHNISYGTKEYFEYSLVQMVDSVYCYNHYGNNYDKYLNNIHYSKFVVHCLLKMKNHIDSTTKFQINGIIWRILYKTWFWLVELTF